MQLYRACGAALCPTGMNPGGTVGTRLCSMLAVSALDRYISAVFPEMSAFT
jgi:hypothetical protein